MLGYALDLEQLVVQLLRNAAEASCQQENARVLVTLRHHHDNLVFSVDDNGKGVPAEIQERIFEPFFTSKPVGRGLGLGLSVAQRISELHQGRLELVPSQLGGACFEVQLPLISDACDAGASSHNS